MSGADVGPAQGGDAPAVQASAPAGGDGALELDTLEQATVGVVVLKHPVSGQATRATVSIAGPEHPARKAAIFARMRARRAEMERAGKLSVSDPADDEQDEIALLVVCTLGWANLSVAGVPLAYSVEAARALYADPKRAWLRDQVKAALDERALFFGACAPG